MVVDGSWVDLITRVDGTFFLERQGFASFMHKTIHQQFRADLGATPLYASGPNHNKFSSDGGITMEKH